MIRINSYDVGRAAIERNVNVNIGRAVYVACSAKWNLGTNSAFALGSRRTMEVLDRIGLQDVEF
jgi:hypothetical protein